MHGLIAHLDRIANSSQSRSETHMKPNRSIGIVLLILGVGLLIIGINSSHSVADQVTHTFLGRFTQTTTWYILGGIVAGGVGLVLTLSGVRGTQA
jgi:uncharacterized membrane protein YidH (DUF202 family)